ncbi:MAG: M20 family metallopeptidase [Acidobacteria bacterium]|nr:M20 family metallopeptidase [Acidobacteriota bacterium]
MSHALLDYCLAREDWLLRFTETLVQIESPSDDKAAVDRCADEVARELAHLGGRITRIGATTAGDHVRAEFGAGNRQVLLLGHIDTVWPIGQLARMPLRREGDRLYGPGVFDMKAGLAIATLAVRAWAAGEVARSHKLVMLWTTDEEVGSLTSRAVIETEAGRSEAVLVFEPALPGGGLKTRRKGCGQYELSVTGRAAHAGVDPEKGVSAIGELARQILAIETLRDLEAGVSVNVGLVSGGSRPNVVADQARAVIDVRAPTQQMAERVDAALRRLTPHIRGAGVVVSGGFARPPMERTAGTTRLFDLASQVAGDLGVSLTEGATGGGSDGNFCAALGVPTLDGLGATGDGAHAVHEHVVVSSLAQRAGLVAGLLTRLTAA